MSATQAVLRRRVAGGLGAALLVAWGAWWFDALRYLDLRWADRLWLQNPAFGADFWSQPEYAARVFASGWSPYASEGHLFHYPPIVIRLFLWVVYFSSTAALRIWVTALILALVAGCVGATLSRKQLGIEHVPLTLVTGLVLSSFPVLFQLERANFDLITLGAILIAAPLLARERKGADFAAGCVLALGPWVKLYPGVMGLALVALRKKWAVLGFAVAGVLIYALAPTETRRSFHVLGIQMSRIRTFSKTGPFPPWSHSLGVAWSLFANSVLTGKAATLAQKIPDSIAAAVPVGAAITFVCWRVLRAKNTGPLAYPLLLWVCAVGSCAPIIANDYSMAFYPLALMAATSFRDPLLAKLGILLSALWWQPFAFPISGWVLLAGKMTGLAGVGSSLLRRTRELDRAALDASR